MNDVSTLELFVRVVEEGSFSAAARFYGVAPSSISRQISQHEDELNTRLFHRTTRKQSLTEAGNVYFEYAQRILKDMTEARLAVSQLSDSPSGSLHITVEHDLAIKFIEPLLAKFLAQYPDLQLRISTNATMNDLISGAIDLAIRVGHLEDSSLIARQLLTSHSIICASPDYLNEYGMPITPAALKQHNCLSFKTSPGINLWCFHENNDVVEIPIKGRLNVNSLSFLRKAALKGHGIVMIPTWMIEKDIEREQLVPLLQNFKMSPSSTPINAVYSHSRYLAPKVRAFVDFLVEHLK